MTGRRRRPQERGRHSRRAAVRHRSGTTWGRALAPHGPWWRAARRWTPDRRQAVAGLVLIVGLVAAAVVGLLGDGGADRHVAVPPTPDRPSSAVSDSPTAPAARRSAGPSFTCPSVTAHGGGTAPDRICIPALKVSTSVMSLGLNADRTVEVPPLSKVREAGWYRSSAAPGEVGPTVILGHVDSAQYGEGVFFRLSKLQPGDQVQLARDDGRIAVFRIDRVTQVSKRSFPSDAVYGATSGPAIRLVTCGGKFDASRGSYEDNIIAFGTLLRVRAA